MLLLIWQLLATAEGPPVLALALSYQWMQVTVGIFYHDRHGQGSSTRCSTPIGSEWCSIGLGWITALAVSIFYGIVLTRRRSPAA